MLEFSREMEQVKVFLELIIIIMASNRDSPRKPSLVTIKQHTGCVTQTVAPNHGWRHDWVCPQPIEAPPRVVSRQTRQKGAKSGYRSRLLSAANDSDACGANGASEPV